MEYEVDGAILFIIAFEYTTMSVGKWNTHNYRTSVIVIVCVCVRRLESTAWIHDKMPNPNTNSISIVCASAPILLCILLKWKINVEKMEVVGIKEIRIRVSYHRAPQHPACIHRWCRTIHVMKFSAYIYYYYDCACIPHTYSHSDAPTQKICMTQCVDRCVCEWRLVWHGLRCHDEFTIRDSSFMNCRILKCT